MPVDAYHRALFVLGPAGGSTLVCPGNQENIPDQDKSPAGKVASSIVRGARKMGRAL